MDKFSPKEKDDLLKDYYTDGKTQKLVIIIGSSIILAMSLLIIILCATSTNKLYENEQLFPGYIPLNSITAKYIIQNTNDSILLFNSIY